jgi:hypothetical protein
MFITEVIQIMADIIRADTCEELGIPWPGVHRGALPGIDNNHPPLAILADECQDTSVTEQLSIVLRGVSKGRLVERFMALESLPDQQAATIHKVLLQFCTKFNINTGRVLGLGSDGCSTWTGVNKGIYALFKKNHPLCAHFWCGNHKLALVAAGAAKSVRSIGQGFNSTLDSLYGLFCQSAPRTHKLKEMQEAMSEPQLAIRRASDTRWLSRDQVCSTVYKSLPSILAFLIMDAYNPNAADKAKVPGLRNNMSDWEFSANLSLMCDVLPVMTRVQRLFQSSTMDWYTASLELPKLRAELENLKETDGRHLDELETFVQFVQSKVREYAETKSAEVQELMLQGEKAPKKWSTLEMELKRFEIEQDEKEVATWHQKTRKAWIQALLDEFDSRFPAKPGIVPALIHLFTVDTLPSLASERKEELKEVYDHYKPILPVEFEHLQEQYIMFTLHVKQMKKTKPGLTQQEYLADFLTSPSADSAAALCLLLKISLTLPFQNVEPERVFSAMNRIKDEERASMGQRMLDNLLVITKNGPDPDKFNFPKAVLTWYMAQERREKLGQRFLWEYTNMHGITLPNSDSVPQEPRSEAKQEGKEAKESKMDG